MNWILFNEWAARHSTRGRIRHTDGIHCAWSHTLLIVNNLTTPAGPVADVADLTRHAQTAIVDAAQYTLPWMFGVPDPWMPVSLEAANNALSKVGLQHVLDMTVMESDGSLLEPRRPLPADVEIRRIESRVQGLDAMNLNCRAYGMPVQIADDVIEADAYFTDPQKEFGFVLYDGDGNPLSTASAIDLGECVYVAAVATDPEHRAKGYAELAMRTALSAAPQKRTALDASRMGAPLYAQMGYESRFQWNFWSTIDSHS